MYSYKVGHEGTPGLVLQMNAQSDVGPLVVSCDFEPLPNLP